ncbi:MAG: pantoate--beta-alanine ligase [Bacteroidales bacterium]|nr:pantoate--beta-alanine ligase [Bacteroidales bacterium]
MFKARTVKELNKVLKELKSNEKQIGFVPTMGALHHGHLSLIKCSKENNDITIASIFVNPTQFNNKNDLKKYPREEQQDIIKLEQAGCDIVFIPSTEEMYPGKKEKKYDFNGLDKVMEGKYREGHFNGVAQIVSKLFKIVKPDNSYFGQKDFQQVAIINYLNENYLQHLNINVISCNIIREEDGLAMSSRNKLLSPDHRNAAPLIQNVLLKYKKQHQKHSVSELVRLIEEEINSNTLLKVEYIDIVDNKTLKTVNKIKEGETTACIAVFAGEVRLIDNISF